MGLFSRANVIALVTLSNVLGCASKAPPPPRPPPEEEAFVLDGNAAPVGSASIANTPLKRKAGLDTTINGQAATTNTMQDAKLPISRQLAGVPLGSDQSVLAPIKDPHPHSSTGPLTGFHWMAPRTQPTLGGVTASATHYGFVGDKLASILVEVHGYEACQRIGADTDALNSNPTFHNVTPKAFTAKWDDGVTLLDFRGDYSSPHHTHDKCIVWMTDQASLHHPRGR